MRLYTIESPRAQIANHPSAKLGIAFLSSTRHRARRIQETFLTLPECYPRS
jgi:hypothetical protein